MLSLEENKMSAVLHFVLICLATKLISLTSVITENFHRYNFFLIQSNRPIRKDAGEINPHFMNLLKIAHLFAEAHLSGRI